MCAFLLYFLSAVTGAVWAQPILFENIEVIDGRGSSGRHNVLTDEQRIRSIDPLELPINVRRIDGTGKSLLPGLIDAHVHIAMIPGEPFREDSAAQRRARHALDLRSYLAWGVTTIVDPGITVEDAQLIRQIGTESPSPELIVIGPLVGPPHGYPANVTKIPAISSSEELEMRINEFLPLQPRGIKVTMEDGHSASIWPLHSAEMLAEIEHQSAERQLPMYVHAMDAKMTRSALKLQPHAMVHASKNGGKRLAKELKEADVYVVTTLDIYGSPLVQWEPNWLDNEMVRLTVPSEALELIANPDVYKKSRDVFLETMLPQLPLWASRLSYGPRAVHFGLKGATKQLKLLNEAGVKLVLGSDSGGWPILTYMLHGPTTHMELELLRRAGLSPQELITASTQRAAEMLGLADQIGAIKVGLQADLLVVEGNPLEDISTLHRPIWVMRDGELRSPKGWMQE